MTFSIELIIGIIFVALVFDFLNGFHDAANSIATIVSTRALRPQYAVAWAAFFNFIAFLFFGLHVANTIGKGVIVPSIADPIVILAALIGAVAWNIITWYYGIPSSSSHALIGGLAGAAVSKGGMHALIPGGFTKIALSIVLAPTIAFAVAFLYKMISSLVLFRAHPKKVDRWARRIQFVSCAFYSLGHGGNDAQKTMGIIAILLFSTGRLGPDFHVPTWVVLICQAAMGLGTLFGGWRIVRTMGMKITKLRPIGAHCAEVGGALTLFTATGLGIPVSTTHTISGAIMGVGAASNASAVRWGVAERIIWAWILTIPASAFISAVSWWGLGHLIR